MLTHLEQILKFTMFTSFDSNFARIALYMIIFQTNEAQTHFPRTDFKLFSVLNSSVYIQVVLITGNSVVKLSLEALPSRWLSTVKSELSRYVRNKNMIYLWPEVVYLHFEQTLFGHKQGLSTT